MDDLPTERDEAAPHDAERRASLKRLGVLWAAVAVPLTACGGGSSPPNQPPTTAPPGGGNSGGTPPPPPGTPPPPPASWTPKTTVLNSTLDSPWSLAFLPDGRMLVTQRTGSMVILSADGKNKTTALAGVPAVASSGQGGLLDVVLDPDFATAGSEWVYFSYSEQIGGLSGTAVTRGRLDAANLQLLDRPGTPLFRQLNKVSGDGHFGSRLVFASDKKLFITLGERQQGSPAQDLTGHLGKVVRIDRNGGIPTDNPFYNTAGAKQEIWSYGHRNPQGAALHPTTGELWTSEHGPQGGDEINRTLAGRNYGWPVISYGQEYGTTDQVGEGTAKAGMEQPATYWEKIDGSAWTPGTAKSSIAPSGLAFYNGTQLTGWKGNLFSGSLAGKALWRIVLNSDNTTVASRERLLVGLNRRIRCVREGPDGWLYLLTDEGELIRVTT